MSGLRIGSFEWSQGLRGVRSPPVPGAWVMRAGGRWPAESSGGGGKGPARVGLMGKASSGFGRSREGQLLQAECGFRCRSIRIRKRQGVVNAPVETQALLFCALTASQASLQVGTFSTSVRYTRRLQAAHRCQRGCLTCTRDGLRRGGAGRGGAGRQGRGGSGKAGVVFRTACGKRRC